MSKTPGDRRLSLARTNIALHHVTRAANPAAPAMLVAPISASFAPIQLDIGDVNGDGRPDIAVADYNYGLVVLRQQ